MKTRIFTNYYKAQKAHYSVLARYGLRASRLIHLDSNCYAVETTVKRCECGCLHEVSCYCSNCYEENYQPFDTN
jgi:hypothetical protein